MPLSFLDPEDGIRLMKMAQNKEGLPADILNLKREIEAKTEEVEAKALASGYIDQGEVRRIVKMKLDLDCLYGRWAEGKL